LGVLEADAADFTAVAAVPAERGAGVLGRLAVKHQEAELESLDETYMLELGSGGQRLEEVPSFERSAEPCIRGPLSGHERMFARPRAGN
jgi:hypothetical protein